MLVYRLTRSRYANDLSGEGARLFGGRWNIPGVACVYTSEHRSLCLCEYLVNTPNDLIPDDLQFVTIRVDDHMVYRLKEDELPLNWKAIPAHQSSQEFGARLLSGKDHFAYKIPSVVIPDEFNIILNPKGHLFEEKVEIVDVSDFRIDSRYTGKD